MTAADLPVPAPAMGVPGGPPILGRLCRAWQANTGKVRLGLAIAGIIARVLPHDMFNHVRAAVYRLAGVRVERDVQILGALTLLGWGDIAGLLEVGEQAAIETPCTISLCAPVRIGRRVHFGMEVMILTGSHEVGPPESRCGPYDFQPIEIGDGTWVGARVTILPGVTIGPGCVIATGAVITRSLPANSLVAGNPARVIGRLDAEQRPPQNGPNPLRRPGHVSSSVVDSVDESGTHESSD